MVNNLTRAACVRQWRYCLTNLSTFRACIESDLILSQRISVFYFHTSSVHFLVPCYLICKPLLTLFISTKKCALDSQSIGSPFSFNYSRTAALECTLEP